MDGRVVKVIAFATVTLAALGGTLAACGGDGDGGEPPIYTEADDGRTVQAAVGDTIAIHLSENPSTGYSWTLRQSSGLSLKVDEFDQPTASPGLVGAPGTHVFALEVTGTGTQIVQAVYERPWESPRDPGRQEYTLTVEVE